MLEPSGWDDADNDCPCMGDAECQVCAADVAADMVDDALADR